MAITKDDDRQYPLVAVVDFALADLTSGSAIEAIDIPANATIIGGELVIETAFNSGTSDTIIVGDDSDDNRYANAVNGQSAARTALTLTGYEYTAKDTIDIKWTAVGTAATAGAGYLMVQYIIKDRANEVGVGG